MGQTTGKQNTTMSSGLWANIYKKYMAVQDKPRSKPFALTQLNGKIREENDQLDRDLGYLDGYYDKIALFFMGCSHRTTTEK
jgi:hypothetical protein